LSGFEVEKVKKLTAGFVGLGRVKNASLRTRNHEHPSHRGKRMREAGKGRGEFLNAWKNGYRGKIPEGEGRLLSA